jgi:hypothetical protein
MYIFGSSLNVVGKYTKDIYISKYIEMQDSYSELIKLLLPEIIDYFELTSYKREVILHRYLKVNSIEYRQSKIKFRDSLTR